MNKFARIITYSCLLAGLLFVGSTVVAQKNSLVKVDKNGVMRWPDQQEVKGFGVNYTVPFAHAYRAAGKLGVDHKQAIKDDVYHFARLGFDLYRVHIWDTEISDTLGNLLENHHLELFDFMLKEMKERNMKFIITPIAFWGNGYPEPSENTPGFANKYGKAACLTNAEAIKAQEAYLFQFLNHINPYTGIAYKDDPDIIAFEVSNEPHHDQEPAKVTGYIDRMVSSMRNTGCKKPIFYNISHSIDLVDAYFDADIQGGTFQWYPTGLLAQEELKGNLLPNVDQYKIEFADNNRFRNSAKIVYEFDAADVGQSYIYPAMARSFRTAGIQLAAHFSYDPTYMAYANTEYSTHYMNLVFTPQKALSLKLASEVFHIMPMYEDYGIYPGNSKFGPFRVSYEGDLAEMINEEKFIYTNNTVSSPANISVLKEIAGFGNSSVVTYEGAGAYFLDQIESGVWRLEVMPDAIWIQDPFGQNSLDKKVAVINWRNWPMSIDHPDLGDNFTVETINVNNAYHPVISGGSFDIMPGTYLLTRNGVNPSVNPDHQWKNITLSEFVAPKPTLDQIYVLHSPVEELEPGLFYEAVATIVSKDEPESVEVIGYGFRSKTYTMRKESGYQYRCVIPAEDLPEGYFRYYISVRNSEETRTFPSGDPGTPANWDFYSRETYQVKIVPESSPVYLFDAFSDFNEMTMGWNREVKLLPCPEPNKARLQVNLEKLSEMNNNDIRKEKIYDYSMKYYFKDRIEGRKASIANKKEIVLRGKSTNGESVLLQLALVTRQGQTFGGSVEVGPQLGDYRLALSGLTSTMFVTLPRPYPTFLPYYYKNDQRGSFDINEAEAIQVSIGPGIPMTEIDKKYGFEIETIRLE